MRAGTIGEWVQLTSMIECKFQHSFTGHPWPQAVLSSTAPSTGNHEWGGRPGELHTGKQISQKPLATIPLYSGQEPEKSLDASSLNSVKKISISAIEVSVVISSWHTKEHFLGLESHKWIASCCFIEINTHTKSALHTCIYMYMYVIATPGLVHVHGSSQLWGFKDYLTWGSEPLLQRCLGPHVSNNRLNCPGWER